jgi:hypothetical protein
MRPACVTEYYKQNVYDTSDNSIGEVSDVLLDKDGHVAAVIVSVGGFLGLGTKYVSVPLNALRVTEGQQTISAHRALGSEPCAGITRARPRRGPGSDDAVIGSVPAAVEVIIQAGSYHGEIFLLLQHERLVTGNEMRVVGTEVVK